MNLFTQYGIKQVADITIYSIIEIGDEEFYLPILYLDSLKISNVEKRVSSATAQGGYGNNRIAAWDFNKNLDIQIKDALFSPASMSLTWGGWLDQRFDRFANLIAKISIMLKYKDMNYSIYAYPSPELTEDEKDILFFGAQAALTQDLEYWEPFYKKDKPMVEQKRVELLKDYYNRNNEYKIDFISIITEINKIIRNYNFSNYTTNIYNTNFIDRMERCLVEQDEFVIDIEEQQNNLFKLFQNDTSSTYNIYYDDKTMKPLIYNQNVDLLSNVNKKIILRRGTTYFKWTRYVSDSTAAALGKEIVINGDCFPRYYKIVGETAIRDQKTGKDQRYQININKAKIKLNSTLTLEAQGDPTVFDFSLTAVTPRNGNIAELKQFDVEKDCEHGGTRISPYDTEYTETGVFSKQLEPLPFTINEYS